MARTMAVVNGPALAPYTVETVAALPQYIDTLSAVAFSERKRGYPRVGARA